MSLAVAELAMRSGVTRGVVTGITPAGSVAVQCDADETSAPVECDVLEQSTGSALVLRIGDEVLVHVAEGPARRGCVLGKIGPYVEENRKRLEIHAEEEIVIRCGHGLIVLRKSGRILLKGLEIVSHAKGRNRVRGGSIQLN